MFDVSWGEIAMLGAVGIAVTGKRDLPAACRFVGQQLGRVVGLLQGARARADRFAHHNELRALQNELRSGLRELDQVKTELAVAASTKGVVGNNLGTMTPSANRIRPSLGAKRNSNHPVWKTPQSLKQHGMTSPTSSTIWNTNASSENGGNSDSLNLSDFDFHVEEAPAEEEVTKNPSNNNTTAAALTSQMDFSRDQQQHHQHSAQHEPELSPAAQSERAVMEEEWTKQGIGFKAQAEMGSWKSDNGGGDFAETIADTTLATGSELLEHLERQCLIFDQYDRVVGEQEAEMEKRVERIKHQRRKKNKDGLDESKDINDQKKQ